MKVLARLVAVLLTGVIAWLGMAQLGTASLLPTLPSTVYGYDSQIDTTPRTSSDVERGLPRAYDYTTYDAADPWSPSTSARLGDSATPAIYAYDDVARLVRSTRGSHAVEWATSVGEAGFAVVQRSSVAANTAGSAFEASDLSAGQASNYARYVKKLPSGAQDPVITRGANGSVQFSADVPGRVPGSYATYTKVVDSSGTTTDYYKTTVAPDGSIVHVKVKFP